MKILITDKNIPYFLDQKQAFHFESKQKRNTYIQSLFFTEDNWEEKIKSSFEIKFIKRDALFATIEFNNQFLSKKNYSKNNIFDKNYCIIYDEKNDNYLFYFIFKIKSDGNFDKLTLNLKFDIWMNYFNFMNKIKNFNLLQGQSNSNNYLGNSFEINDRKVVEVLPLKKNNYLNNADFEVIKDVPFFFIIKKSTSNSSNNLILKNENQDVLLPYEVILAPITPVKSSNSGNTDNIILFNKVPMVGNSGEIEITLFDNFNVQEILQIIWTVGYGDIFYTKNTSDIVLNEKYTIDSITGCFLQYELTSLNTMIIYWNRKGQRDVVRNYNVNQINSLNDNEIDFIWDPTDLIKWLAEFTDDTILDVKTNNVNYLEFDENTTLNNIPNLEKIPKTDEMPEHFILKYITIKNMSITNTYTQNIEEESFNWINGLQTKEILLENKFYLDIPDWIRKTGEVTFTHLSIPLPNEWEERVWILNPEDGSKINITDDNNKMLNDGSIIYAQNAFETYKANNPITSKLSPVANAFSGVKIFLLASLLSGKKQSKALISSLLGIKEIGNFWVDRITLKNKPISISGSGNGYYDIYFNNYNIRWTLVKYQYISVINAQTNIDIKRHGMSYENLFINKYVDIKRPFWNFIKIDDISNLEIKFNFNIQVLTEINNLLKIGVTFWNDANNYFNYDLNNLD